MRKALRESDVVICATSEWKNIVEQITGSSHHSVSLYRPENCINRLYPLNEEKFNSSQINLVFVGWLDDRKALIFVLEALSKLPKDTPIKLHVLGVGSLRAKYELFAKSHGIEHLVEWHGRVPREDVFSTMNNSHLMVLPSLMDANTTVIWEAMAMGLPTLALDHFGFHDTIVNGKTGFLIKPSSHKQVVNDIRIALENIVSLPARLKEMAEAVMKDREQYTGEKRCDFFENVYDLAISNFNKKIQ